MKNRLLREHLLLICAATFIAPFLALAFFCHPAVDDFCFVQTVHEHGFLGAHIFWFTQWSGRFISNGLLSIHPLLLNSITAYKVTLCFIIILSIGAAYRLVDAITGQAVLTIRKITVALFINAIYLYSMPSVVQAVYWLPGVISYQISPLLLLLYLSQIIRHSNASIESPRRNIRLWVTTTTLFVALCCNESFTAAVAVIIGSIALRQLFVYKSISRELIFAASALILEITIELLAPGNYVRLAESPVAKSLPKTLFHTAQIAFDNILNLSTSGAAVIALIASALLTVLHRARIKLINTTASQNPVVVFGVALAIQIAVFFPSIFINGEAPGRVFNTAWFFWLCSIVLITISVTNRILNTKFFAATSTQIPRIIYLILAGTIGVILLIPNNISVAYREILTGEATRYEQTQQKRYRQMMEFTGDTCVVAPISPQPRLLFFGDITKTADSWQNKPYAEYFKIKNVKLGF